MLQGKINAGHPVDVASGNLFSSHEDINIPGKIPLTWERSYSNALSPKSPTPMGKRWTSPYFSVFTREGNQYRLFSPEGDLEIFDDPDGALSRGETLRNPGTFQELSKHGDRFVVTQWETGSEQVRRLVFKTDSKSDTWPLAAVENVTGHALDLEYNAAGQLKIIRQRLEQRALLIDYTAKNQVETVSFLSSEKKRKILARYEYDKKGHLVSAINAEGYADSYAYDRKSRMVREIVKDGGVFEFFYDDLDRCIRTTGQDGYDEKRFRYLDFGWTEVTDSRGNITRYQWLPNGQIITEIDPLGGTTKTGYDIHGRIVARTDPNEGVTTFAFDKNGNMNEITNPLGQTTTKIFNENHLPVEITNGAGHVWRRVYDRNNNPILLENPDGSAYGLTYDRNGNLTGVQDPLGNQYRRHYSEQGLLESATDWQGHAVQYKRDEFGRLIERIDPLGNRTLYQYDILNRLVRAQFPDGTLNEYDYDPAGNPVRFTLEGGGQKHTTHYRFGSCNRIMEMTDPAGKTLRFKWGTEPGHLETVVNAREQTYRFQYDAAGRLVQETGFDGRQLSYEYDPAGNRTARINGMGERVEYERDALGRMVAQHHDDGLTESFAYDGSGFLKSAANAAGQITFERDRMGRIVVENQNGHTIERSFDPAGNLKQLLTDLGLKVDYTFDPDSLLTQFTVNDKFSTVLDRDERGSEVRRIMPHEIELNQQFDAMGRLTQQLVFPRAPGMLMPEMSTDTFVMRSYRYEMASLAAMDDKDWEGTTYVHDPLERLTRTLREKGVSEEFQFDDTDNITRIDRGDDSKTLSYAPGNRLANTDDTTFVYDDHGRLVRKSQNLAPQNLSNGELREWHYEWDALDQLRKVTTPEGQTWEYAYDPFGRRIRKIAPDGTVHGFVWDEDVVVHEFLDEKTTASWVFDPHSFSPLAKLQEDEIYSVISDQVGTPREMIDRFGEIVWQADFFAWGEIREQKANKVDCPIRFQGQWFDSETGLHYNRFRYYDPSVGRYISPDPVGLAGGFNLYAYVVDPCMWIDPFGLEINTTADRTHITYRGSKGGKTYVGYASMPGERTGQEVLSYRYGSTQTSEGLDGPPEVLYRGYGQDLESSRTQKATARGLEQRYFEQAGGLGKTANRENPVGPNNQNRQTYLDNADEHLEQQKKKKSGGCQS